MSFGKLSHSFKYGVYYLAEGRLDCNKICFILHISCSIYYMCASSHIIIYIYIYIYIYNSLTQTLTAFLHSYVKASQSSKI